MSWKTFALMLLRWIKPFREKRIFYTFRYLKTRTLLILSIFPLIDLIFFPVLSDLSSEWIIYIARSRATTSLAEAMTQYKLINLSLSTTVLLFVYLVFRMKNYILSLNRKIVEVQLLFIIGLKLFKVIETFQK